MKNRQNKKINEGEEDYTLKDFDLKNPTVVRDSMGVKPKYEGNLRMYKTSISLPKYIIDDLRRLARIRGMSSYQSVLREILSEKIYEEKRRLDLF